MALPDYTTQDAATYKANIDSEIAKSRVLNTKIIDIGDWNMDSSPWPSVNPVHGLTLSKIRNISVIIRNNTGTQYYDFNYLNNNETSHRSISVNATVVILLRADIGGFDNPLFNSTSYNRGWITIQYTD